MIEIDIPTSQYIYQRGGSFRAIVMYGDQELWENPVITYIDGTNWVSYRSTGGGSDGEVYQITVSAIPDNTYLSGRKATIRFAYSEGSPSYGDPDLILYIYQFGNSTSIWADRSVFVSRSGSQYQGVNVKYKITDTSNNILYEGVSAATSSTSYASSIYLNRILASYIESNDLLYADETFIWESDGRDILPVVVRRSADDSIVGLYSFVYDYSYDRETYSSKFLRNNLISKKISKRMYPSFAITDTTGTDTYYYDAYNGSTLLETENLGICTATTSDMEVPAQRYGLSNQNRLVIRRGNTVILDLDTTGEGQGAIYYLNKQGAWDYFHIEGNIRKYNIFDREDFKSDYNNTQNYNTGKMTVRNRVTTRWEFATGWLTDEQSKILVENLLRSPRAHLQLFGDSSTNTYPIPILITNSESEIKKFRNGRQLVQYVITAENSQTQVIR